MKDGIANKKKRKKHKGKIKIKDEDGLFSASPFSLFSFIQLAAKEQGVEICHVDGLQE
jgi:hypothetical protein